MHRLLAGAGGLLFLLAVLQLPLSVYYQNSRPSMNFMTVQRTAEGLVMVPNQAVEALQAPVVKPGDILTHFDGLRVDSAAYDEQALLDAVAAKHLGDTLRLDIIREGRRMVLYSQLRYSRGEVYGIFVSLAIYLYNTVAPIVSLLIALIVLLRRPRNRQSIMYFLSAWNLSFYLLTISSISQFIPWWSAIAPYQRYLSVLAAYLFQAMLLHFLLIFPEERILAERRALRNTLLYVPYVAGAMLELFAPVLSFGSSTVTIIRWADTVLFTGGTLVGIAIVVSSSRHTMLPGTRRILKVIVVGLSFYGAAVFLNTGSQLINLREMLPLRIFLVVNLSLIVVITFSLPLSFGYAILRYGFLDVRIIFKRTTVYGILAGAVVLFFIGFYALLQYTFASSRSMDVLFVAAIVTGVVAIAVGFVKERVQAVVDKLVFSEEFRIRSALADLSRRLLHILDRDAVLVTLTNDLRTILGLQSASVIAFDATACAGAQLAGDPISDEQLRQLASSQEMYGRLREQAIFVTCDLQEDGENRRASVVCPIASSNGEHVAVVLGGKSSGKPLSVDEIAMLDSVASHAALGWKNASVTEEMKAQERLKKEIEIAHSIQEAMMPTHTPDIPGFDIAAVSLPAREVGGDFFDFLQPDDDSITMILGDVSDKGVSAAMVMASSISTLRFAAEQETSPCAALAIANRRLFLDTHRHMFVAAFFGILDVRTAELTFTNAGLPKPLLHRANEGYLIDWSENGQHLPLGARQDIVFHQQSLQLQPGDVLVLYTDGVVEARNAHDEEFGVKRLRDVVRMAAESSADDIKRIICEEVNGFTGRTELFDDLTIIVLKPS